MKLVFEGLLMKQRTLDGFGQRLTELRKSRGLTQQELGRRVGVSNRVVAYYEADGAQPPGALLVELARALNVSSDQLLGLKPPKEKTDPKTARMLKRLRKVSVLSRSEQQAVLKFIDTLAGSRSPS